MTFNPFTEIEDALRHVVESFAGLTSVVRIGNRVLYNGTIPKAIDSRQPGDLPELALMAAGMQNDQRGSAGSKFMAQSYDWMIATDDERMRGDADTAATPRGFNSIKAALYLAHERNRRPSGAGVPADTLPGCEDWVRKVTVGECTEQVQGQPNQKPGWHGVARVTVEMVFPLWEVVV